MGSRYDNPEELNEVEKAFRQGKSRGLILKMGEFNSTVESYDPRAINPNPCTLTRADFECEEDWITYSLNQWFGHLFIDPHID